MRWAIRWGFTSPPDKLVTPEAADQLQPLQVGDTLLANKGYDANWGVIDPLNAEAKERHDFTSAPPQDPANLRYGIVQSPSFD